jgi:hypothetical protein
MAKRAGKITMTLERWGNEGVKRGIVTKKVDRSLMHRVEYVSGIDQMLK